MSKSTNLFSEFITVFVYPTVALIGFLFNLICTIVLMQKGMREAKCDFFRYLLFKAVINALFLALFAAETIVQNIFMEDASSNISYIPTILAISNIYYFLTEILKSLSILCEIAACLDRLMYVKHCCQVCYRKIPPYLAFLIMVFISVLTHFHLLAFFKDPADVPDNGNNNNKTTVVLATTTSVLNTTTSTSSQMPRGEQHIDHLVNNYINTESLNTEIVMWFIYIVIINIVLIIINVVLWYETSRQMMVKKRLTAIESLIVHRGRSPSAELRQVKPNMAMQNISRMVLWMSMLTIVGQVLYYFTFFDLHPIIFDYINPVFTVLFLLSYSLDLFFYYSFNFLFRKTLQNIYRSLCTKNPTVSV